MRFRVQSYGYFSKTYWWAADTGALLAYRYSSDTPAYCNGTTSDLIYGDPAVVTDCPLSTWDAEYCN